MYGVMILSLLAVFLVPSMVFSFALESDTDYVINSDSVFLILEVDSSNNVNFTDGGITINDTYNELDMNQVKVLRVTENGDHGRIFGKTIQGDNYYIVYDIDGNNATIYSKIWQDNTNTRLIENANIDKLF